jgi:hypothetical protein
VKSIRTKAVAKRRWKIDNARSECLNRAKFERSRRQGLICRFDRDRVNLGRELTQGSTEQRGAPLERYTRFIGLSWRDKIRAESRVVVGEGLRCQRNSTR